MGNTDRTYLVLRKTTLGADRGHGAAPTRGAWLVMQLCQSHREIDAQEATAWSLAVARHKNQP
jgi:hypothetical protein